MGTDEKRNRVILIHGFATPSFSMALLAWRLRKRGHQTICWNYPSFRLPIGDISERFIDFVDGELHHGENVCIVAHSLGTAVLRASLAHLDASRFSRVVFLAPPIIGTPLADYAPKLLYKLMPPLKQLVRDKDGYVANLSVNFEELGIIAGRLDLHVPLACTRCSSASDRVEVWHTHNSLLFSRAVAKLADQFLTSGAFGAEKSGE